MTLYDLLAQWVDLEVRRTAWLRLQQQLPKGGRMSRQMAEALITQQLKSIDIQQERILTQISTRFNFGGYNPD